MTAWYDDPWKVKFLERIEVRDDGCWMWQGYRDKYYGRWYAGDTAEHWAHRNAYKLHHGDPVPNGLTVDHLCRETFCVNPLHMEAVTQAENTRRAAEARRAERGERHGVLAAYVTDGCRCDDCQEAYRQWSVNRRAERRRQFAAGEIEIEHGTRNGYAYYLCRCDACSEAGLADAEKWRRKRGVKPQRRAQHGTTSMYTRHKCRCELCRRNWNQYWREHRAAKREQESA